MIYAYINYPNPHMTVHRDPSCKQIMSHLKLDRRVVEINAQNLSNELMKFKMVEYKFAASREINDLWLRLDFDNYDFEIAVANYLLSLLSKNYSPFINIRPELHC